MSDTMDAKRYRWLKAQILRNSHKFPIPKDFTFPEGALFNQSKMIDAAIDAAMKEV